MSDWDRSFVPYAGGIQAAEAWMRPTPDMDIDKPAVYYTVYDASEDARGARDGRVWLGIAKLDELAPIIFADWGFGPIAAAVSSVVRASYDAERRAR